MAWHRGVVIKTARDLEAMRSAGRVNAQALAAAVSAVRPGVSTADVNAVAVEVLRHHGAGMAFLGYPGPYPYPAATCISVNDELVHGIPGPRRLQAGDIVSIDCGSVVDGFDARRFVLRHFLSPRGGFPGYTLCLRTSPLPLPV